MNKCKTSSGKKLLRQWLISPLNEKAKILKRQNSVEFIIKNIIECGSLDQLKRELKCVPLCQNIINSLKLQPRRRDFLLLNKFLEVIPSLEKLYKCLNTEVPMLDLEFIKEMKTLITKTIDLSQKKDDTNHHIIIKGRVCDELDFLRRQYNDLPQFLSEIVHIVAGKVENNSEDLILNVIYFPQIGFLVASPESYLGDYFKLQFKSEKVSYYKCCDVERLDVEIGDIYGKISDLEIDIINSLIVNSIEPFEENLLEIERHCAQIDCLQSMAIFTLTYSLIKPEIINENILIIKNGRHILQQCICNQIIANDLVLNNTKENPNHLLITGPNGSGKSIFMKQNAIIVILAQMGSYVPCEEAKIGLVDRIFSRIQTRESYNNNDSAFQKDLKQMSQCINQCTDKSLLLIDEFGKGTRPNDGIALFAAIINSMISNQAISSTRSILITHFHEIYQNEAIILNRSMIQWSSMDVIIEKDTSFFDGDSNPQNQTKAAIFLYKVIGGKGIESRGIEMAHEMGLPSSIIRRSLKLKEMYKLGIPTITMRYDEIDLEDDIYKKCEKVINLLTEPTNENIQKIMEMKEIL